MHCTYSNQIIGLIMLSSHSFCTFVRFVFACGKQNVKNGPLSSSKQRTVFVCFSLSEILIRQGKILENCLRTLNDERRIYLHNNYLASSLLSAAIECRRWTVQELKCRPLQLSNQFLSHRQSSFHRMSSDRVLFHVAAVVVDRTSLGRWSRSSRGCCCCSEEGRRSSLHKSLRRQNRGRHQTCNKGGNPSISFVA